jgi:TusA-related sulfurtransferase
MTQPQSARTTNETTIKGTKYILPFRQPDVRMMIINPDKILDCTGLYCPEPVFRTRLGLDELEEGQTLKVTADDPAAEEDIRRLVKRLGHEILSLESDGDEVEFLIRKLK